MKTAQNPSLEWTTHAKDLIFKRYISKDVEIPQWIHSITKAVTKNYRQDRELVQKKYFELLNNRRFLPTSAALHNSIEGKGSLSGCIVLPLSSHPQDVIEKDLPKITTMLMKGIGVGLDLTPLPPRLHPDSRTRRSHSGPIETLKALTNATDALVSHGGVKRAAYMGSLNAAHPDIAHFIALKRTEKMPTVNVSVTIDAPFKRALKEGLEIPFTYSLDGEKKFLTLQTLSEMVEEGIKRDVDPPDLIVINGQVISRSLNEAIGSVQEDILYLSPQKLFLEMAKLAHACGDPGLIDLENINEDNPTHPRYAGSPSVTGVGEINVTTPCGEQPLLPYEVCHLGSFNLAAFTTDEGFNFPLFQESIYIAVQLMDDLIDRSDNQLPEANVLARTNRKIGIGLMGLADALAMLFLPYNSKEGLAFAEKIACTLQTTARQASEELAKSRGAFSTFPHSKFAHAKMAPRRHATLTTIAPTGHISTLAGCSPSIEPYFRLTYTRKAAGFRLHENEILKNKLKAIDWSLEAWIAATKAKHPSYEFDGTLQGLISNPFDEEERNVYVQTIKKVFVTAGELSYEEHLSMVALFQKYTDNGVSKTINLPKEATVEEVYAILMKAIDLGLKGVTVYRDRCQETQALMAPQGCVTCDIYGCA